LLCRNILLDGVKHKKARESPAELEVENQFVIEPSVSVEANILRGFFSAPEVEIHWNRCNTTFQTRINGIIRLPTPIFFAKLGYINIWFTKEIQ